MLYFEHVIKTGCIFQLNIATKKTRQILQLQIPHQLIVKLLQSKSLYFCACNQPHLVWISRFQTVWPKHQGPISQKVFGFKIEILWDIVVANSLKKIRFGHNLPMPRQLGWCCLCTIVTRSGHYLLSKHNTFFGTIWIKSSKTVCQIDRSQRCWSHLVCVIQWKSRGPFY